MKWDMAAFAHEMVSVTVGVGGNCADCRELRDQHTLNSWMVCGTMARNCTSHAYSFLILPFRRFRTQ